MDYRDMLAAAREKAESGGFGIGTQIRYKGRPGRVVDVNAFFYDHDPMPVVVDLDAVGKRAARSRDLVSMAELVPA